ncbi:hypothetical protein FB645_005688, partial [Coemansia sp. IMI 203386]
MSAAKIFWDDHKFSSFTLHQGSSATTDADYLLFRQGFQPGCILDTANTDQDLPRINNRQRLLPQLALVVWDDAVGCGCFSYAQVANLVAQSTQQAVDGILFGSAVTNDNYPYGSPIIEPLSELQTSSEHSSSASSLFLTLTASSTAKSLAAGLEKKSTNANESYTIVIQVHAETSPWDMLIASPGFLAQKYL